MSRHEIISPEDIKRRIALGEPVVIYEGYVLHLGEWITMHPGGKLAILHMVGRDATDEINMYVRGHAQTFIFQPAVQPCRLWKSHDHAMSPERCGSD